MPHRREGSKGPRIQRCKDSRPQGFKLLAEGTRQKIIGAEINAEPAEVQNPLPAVPVEARDIPVAVANLPDRGGEDQIEIPKFLWNLLVML